MSLAFWRSFWLYLWHERIGLRRQVLTADDWAQRTQAARELDALREQIRYLDALENARTGKRRDHDV